MEIINTWKSIGIQFYGFEQNILAFKVIIMLQSLKLNQTKDALSC